MRLTIEGGGQGLVSPVDLPLVLLLYLQPPPPCHGLRRWFSFCLPFLQVSRLRFFILSKIRFSVSHLSRAAPKARSKAAWVRRQAGARW